MSATVPESVQLQSQRLASAPLTMNKADLAENLRCSERQVDKLRPELPEPFYLGSSPRWSREAIVSWIAERQVSAAEDEDESEPGR